MISVYSYIFRALLLLSISYRTYKKQTLTNLGCFTALVTGLIHCFLLSSNLYILLVVWFFVSSTYFTKFKAQRKLKKLITVSITDNPQHKINHSARNHVQVIANSFTSTVLILAVYLSDLENRYVSSSQSVPSSKLYESLIIGIIANYSSVISDTWSSELGILSESSPILITNFKKCPPGTNGGVTFFGLASGVSGALSIAIISVGFLQFIFKDFTVLDGGARVLLVFSLIVLSGLFGTLLDSYMGATLQLSVASSDSHKIIESLNGEKISSLQKIENIKRVSGLDILSNNGVNYLMTLITSTTFMIIYYCFT
ncbi:DUF92 domain-containing protein ASCRUDRAFT_73065 [Ascoidea rubescens DSM 1968]|uniref:DUF92-domain-containing protein n=1 Tax=Ascoidea rubescens DSM 1968 TaxID=1344418 RepID=A0A1D2V8V9_9ASCO|nr:hypothetical protein ASCRUDRAFT_73065 [Ascoidea rubescens DSM 1968]ODV57883.1 hypothetical protein ASCRUDRAFT_73065 [Ascoidea rubescens DSM 1968]